MGRGETMVQIMWEIMTMVQNICQTVKDNAQVLMALATIGIAIFNLFYILHLQGQSRRDSKRAMCLLVLEVSANRWITTFERPTPFLDTAYSTSGWALASSPMSEQTIKLLLDACASVKRF